MNKTNHEKSLILTCLKTLQLQFSGWIVCDKCHFLAGIGDSIGRGSATSWTDSRRSDSCDTDKNVEAIRSESDDPGGLTVG